MSIFIFSYREFLAPGCHNPVNVDSTIAELVRRRIENNPDRYCFDEAQVYLSCDFNPSHLTIYYLDCAYSAQILLLFYIKAGQIWPFKTILQCYSKE